MMTEDDSRGRTMAVGRIWWRCGDEGGGVVVESDCGATMVAVEG
ncbi:hypothetical protein Hanom_Chr17g01529961 [Helianthus anomalus]